MSEVRRSPTQSRVPSTEYRVPRIPSPDLHQRNENNGLSPNTQTPGPGAVARGCLDAPAFKKIPELAPDPGQGPALCDRSARFEGDPRCREKTGHREVPTPTRTEDTEPWIGD